MNIVEIHQLLDTLEKSGWYTDDFTGQRERFFFELEDLYNKNKCNSGPVYAFLTFIAHKHGADSSWTPEAFTKKFKEAYRGGGLSTGDAVRQFILASQHPKLAPVALDPSLNKYFDWDAYANGGRIEVAVHHYNGLAYLFKK